MLLLFISFTIIELGIISFLTAKLFIKSRTINQSVISVGKLGYYTKADETNLKQYQEAIVLFRQYIYGHIRTITTSLGSERFDSSGNEIIKGMEEIYKEKGALRQLGEISIYLNGIIEKDKQ